MIPKIIHYCWLSDDPIPNDLVKYMDTWREKLPHYEFVHWNLDRFDINSSVWVKQAFEAKKYAFAADYIRLYALYNHGGIYLDMDVEIVKAFDPFLDLTTMIGFENTADRRLEMAVFGVEKKSEWVKKCMAYYECRGFVNIDGTFNTKVLPLIIRDALLEVGIDLKPVNSIEEAKKIRPNEIPIFPFRFFSPKSFDLNTIMKNNETYAIHHFSSSWWSWYEKLEARFWRLLNKRNRYYLHRMMNNLNRY